MTTTRDIIEKGNDTKIQAELAQKYIDTLTNLSAELAAQQQAMVGTGPSQQIQQTAPPGQQQVVFVSPSQPKSGQQQQAPSTQPQSTLPSSGQAGVTQSQVQQPAQTPPIAAPQIPVPHTQPVAPVVQKVPLPSSGQAPRETSGQAPPAPIVAAQISQTQANIAQTIKELEQVTKKSQQQEHKQEEKKEAPKAQQPQEQHKEEKGKGKEQ